MSASMTTARSALVLGATGLVGQSCLALLLEDSRYAKVHAVVRTPLGHEHPRLQAHVVSFTALGLTVGEIGATDVFCCLGTTIKKAGSREAFRQVDYEYPLAAAQSALQGGAQQFLLVSSMGANPDSWIYYNRVKGEVERDIAALPFATVHILRPSLLLGERDERRVGETIAKAAMKVVKPLMIGGASKYRAIAGATVARAMIALAQQEQSGRHIHESDALERLGAG